MNWSRGIPERSALGKIAYGLLFCVFLPGYLFIWADRLDHLTLPSVPDLPFAGMALAFLGLAMLLAGNIALVRFGDGLPMNPYPPPRYVSRGIFGWIAHPIYIGFSLSCVGISVTSGSAPGLWIVTPAIMLGSAALVWGHERPRLLIRFGSKIGAQWLRLPPDDGGQPSVSEKCAAAALVFIPWLILYEGVASHIGVVGPVLVSTLRLEARLPVWEITAVPYFLVYAFVPLAPFIAPARADLRAFAVAGLLSTAIVIPFYLTVPVIAPFRGFEPTTVFGELILLQRAVDNPATAFPAFHVTWTLLAARLYARRFPQLRHAVWLGAGIMALSSWTTGMHALLDLAGGAFVYVFAASYRAIWRWCRRASERIANSWQDWRVGPVRIINHGIYAGAAATVGFVITGRALEPASLAPCLLIGVCGLIGAGLWAQVAEGSDRLLRPFGYYGGLLGAAIGVLSAHLLLGLDLWRALAALAIAAPWVQAIGRLRCLVQGCCHGSKSPADVGIRYAHPMSRVCQLAGLRDQPVYPTPLYSILGNIVVGLCTFRLAMIGAPAGVIVGSYLMLSSLARFVEEAYRGEPQTAIIAGLKIYQWLAVAGIMAGSLATMAGRVPFDFPVAGTPMAVWLGGLCFGLVSAAAMGIDFRHSDRRFARLA